MKKIVAFLALFVLFSVAPAVSQNCNFSYCVGSVENYSPTNPIVGTTYTWTVSGGQSMVNLTNDSVLVTWASPGVYTLTLTSTQGSCTAVSTCQITVNNSVTVNAQAAGPFCAGEPPTNLTATPAGGVWSGPGVTGNQFDPSVAGPGTHNLSYTYTDPNGCQGLGSLTITVTPEPGNPVIQNNP